MYVASIVDGRFKGQKNKMNNSCFNNKIILVEGKENVGNGQIFNKENVRQTIVDTIINEDFLYLFTNCKETGTNIL